MKKLRSMMLFMTIVESGSMTKAAEKLNLSKSVLSQHLKQLEIELSTTLLKRTTRRQSLTSAGEQFYRQCCKLQVILDQAWDEILIQQQVPKGKLTVTAPHALMDILVLPALTRTFSHLDDVSLELICSESKLDLMSHGIDLAIRVGESSDSSYRQKRIGEFRDALCQSIDSAVQIEDAHYIANHWQPEYVTHNVKGKGVCFEAKHKTNTIQQTIALIKANMGIGLVPDILLNYHSGIKVIEYMNVMNVYALHPYSGAVPITVTMAQEAIKEDFASLMPD